MLSWEQKAEAIPLLANRELEAAGTI